MFPFDLAIGRRRTAMRIDIIYIYMVLYTLFDISPICTQVHNIMLWVSRALAGVEVLCGRLAAFVLVK